MQAGGPLMIEHRLIERTLAVMEGGFPFIQELLH